MTATTKTTKRWTVEEAVAHFDAMPETAKTLVGVLKVCIADKTPIGLLDGRNIWTYSYSHSKGEWYRSQLELKTPASARRRMDSLDDEDGYYCLAPTHVTECLAWLDKLSRAHVDPVKWGFIMCEGKEESAVLTCTHVMNGAPVKDYLAPVPWNAQHGEALCAECAASDTMEYAFRACYRCYLKYQMSDIVVETYTVVANDGNTANITRDGDDAEFHIHRPDGIPVEKFRDDLPIGKVIEMKRRVERTKPVPTSAVAAAA